MGTIYGESPEIPIDNSYASNGGIAMFSVEDDGNHTITGGSGDNPGEDETSARIRWSITIDANGNYVTGGITGSEFWMREHPVSPFVGWTDQQLANFAIDGNLNEVFGPWNSSHDFGEVFGFMIDAWEKYPSCVYGIAG